MQVLKEKGVNTILLSPQGGKGKLSPQAAAEKLVDVVRNAGLSSKDIPDEVEVPTA